VHPERQKGARNEADLVKKRDPGQLSLNFEGGKFGRQEIDNLPRIVN
jgi:hypothetical protein